MKPFLFFLFASTLVSCNTVKLKKEESFNYTQEHYRALEIINDSTILLAGTNSTIILLNPISKSWRDISPKPKSSLDYRSSAVLNDSTFFVASAGSPGFILKTCNYGQTWDTTWVNTTPTVFIDGLCFANDSIGYAYGDPLDNYFLVLKTTNAGKSWDRIADTLLPNPLESEASFAASNGGILAFGDTVYLAYSSPKQNRLIYSYNKGLKWNYKSTKMRTGEAMGTFAIAKTQNGLALVGGSFTDSSSVIGTGNFFPTMLDSCRVSETTPPAYCSGIACMGDTCIAVGRNGTMRSLDGGKNWQQIDTQAFYTVRYSKWLFILTGKNGRIKQYLPNSK